MQIAHALVFVVAGLGQTGDVSSKPIAAAAEKPAEKDVAELIRQLGSGLFRQREEAQARLLKFGPAARKELEAAANGEDREIARRAAAVLEQLRKQDLGDAEVHVVGLYEARDRKAIVEVRGTAKPIILVLCAYEGVNWKVQRADKARILQVIASGYHKQNVEVSDVPVTTMSYDERNIGQDGRGFYFFTYDHDEERYPDMVAKVRTLTGKGVSSFQGRYSFRAVPFVVGGGVEK